MGSVPNADAQPTVIDIRISDIGNKDTRPKDNRPTNIKFQDTRIEQSGSPRTTASPPGPYPEGYMTDPEYNTETDYEVDRKTNHVLNFDKFNLNGMVIETNNHPMDAPVSSQAVTTPSASSDPGSATDATAAAAVVRI